MVNYQMIAIAGFLASANGLPLNINLGAYSPALVVGDGEISFGGGQDVTNLLNALEGAAVSSAAASNAAGNDATNGAAQDIQALEAPSDSTTPTESSNAVVAQSSETAVPTSVSTPEATPAVADPNPQEQATQTGLQGMGKEIAPREESERPKVKRGLQGFDRALTYAEAALTKGPIIQLGTGEGGAGVGIIVDNRPDAGAGRNQNRAKRNDATQPRRRTKVTRMYLKRGVPAAIQSSPDFETRAIDPLPALDLPALSKRDSSDAISAINLNIPGDEGVTMTFIETSDSDNDDEAQEVVTSE